MEPIDPEFVERYQLVYQRNPQSQVFAILAEAYRKMGMLEKALQIATNGLSHHPHFASGQLVAGRIYSDLNRLEKAVEHLQKAVALAPENLLAYQILAKTLLQLRRPKEALHAYKMIMLMNPHDEAAKESVKQLESLTADEFSEEVFQLKSVKEVPARKTPIPATKETAANKTQTVSKTLERLLSLADALAARNEVEKSIGILISGQTDFGPHPEISERLRKFRQLNTAVTDLEELKPLNRRDIAVNQKRDLLNKLLSQIQSRKRQTDAMLVPHRS